MKPDFPVPAHIAVIMDGNGRWARRGGLARIRGHESGVKAVRDTVEASAEWGIRYLTLYSFSAENWERPRSEVNALMRLLERFLRSELELMLREGVRLRGLGRLEDLPPRVLRVLRETEAATAHGQRMTLFLALSYGGRQEIADAARELAEEVAAGRMRPEDVNESSLRARFYAPDMPDPDLVIRTAGEQRLSNFLLWEASYAEFYFADVL